MMSRAQLIVVVSHDLGSLEKVCDRGIWMDHGRIRQVGPISQVVAAYTESVNGGKTQAA
jgi:ABC-type polysaccharide/polyol phosphate transport system ATPase subunit